MVSFDASVDYMALIQKALAEGNYAAAAEYEQQRNAKIDATGSAYPKTYDYQQYLNTGNTSGVDFKLYRPLFSASATHSSV